MSHFCAKPGRKLQSPSHYLINMTLSKRLLTPILVAGALVMSNRPASAQSVTCSLSTPLGTTSIATATGHTEPIAAGSNALLAEAGGGTVRVTCTNAGATFMAGAGSLLVSLNAPITNTTSHPSPSTGIRLSGGTGAFVTGVNVGISAVNNSTGAITIGLGTPVSVPDTGITFPAASSSTFDLQGVLVSMVGRSSVSATLSVIGTGFTAVPGPVGVVAAVSNGILDPVLSGEPAVVTSAGVIKGNFTVKIQENYPAVFRDYSQFNGGGVFPQSPSSDATVMLQFNNIPNNLTISGCSVTITDLNGVMSDGVPTLSQFGVFSFSPILSVNFLLPVDLTKIDVLWVSCDNVSSVGAVHGPDVTVQATLAPVGAALSNGGGALTSLITGQVPRYQMLRQPSVPLTAVSILAPSITSIAPSSASPGDNLFVTVNGSRLATTSQVTFSGNGISASIVDANDTAVIVAVTVQQSAAPGLRTVTVTTDEGTTLPFSGFTVIGPVRKNFGQVTSQ
jgi:hypothetical protein